MDQNAPRLSLDSSVMLLDIPAGSRTLNTIVSHSRQMEIVITAFHKNTLKFTMTSQRSFQDAPKTHQETMILDVLNVRPHVVIVWNVNLHFLKQQELFLV